MANLSISVIVCAYSGERWHDLLAAIASVQAQTIPPHELIVVIDHNTELLARLKSTVAGVVLVENREGRGLSGARNSGLAGAGGEVIAFLDDDAVAAPDWLAKLVGAYSDARVVGVGGAIEADWVSGRPHWFPEEFDWVVGCTYRGMPRETAPVRNLIGSNMSFRCDVFAETGGFTNGIGRIGKRPLGCEETELCIRAQRHLPGAIFLYEPGAKVRHRVPVTRGRWSYFRARCFAEGLSKALVVHLVGTEAGLASERAYILRTLPGGVVRGLLDAILRRDWGGLGRAIAIIAGLAITTAGYLTGTVALRRSRSRKQHQSKAESAPPKGGTSWT